MKEKSCIRSDSSTTLYKKEIQTQGDLVLGGANKLNSQGRKLDTKPLLDMQKNKLENYPTYFRMQ